MRKKRVTLLVLVLVLLCILVLMGGIAAYYTIGWPPRLSRVEATATPVPSRTAAPQPTPAPPTPTTVPNAPLSTGAGEHREWLYPPVDGAGRILESGVTLTRSLAWLT